MKIKCPRCHIEQEKEDVCKYCGLDFSTLHQKGTDGISQRNIVGIIILCFFIFTLCGIYFFQKSGEEKNASEFSAKSPISDGLNIPDLNKLMDSVSNGGGLSRGSIIAAIIFSIIGMGYFSYGKRANQYTMLFSGIALMIYPYFVHGILMLTVSGIEICFLPFVLTMVFE